MEGGKYVQTGSRDVGGPAGLARWGAVSRDSYFINYIFFDTTRTQRRRWAKFVV